MGITNITPDNGNGFPDAFGFFPFPNQLYFNPSGDPNKRLVCGFNLGSNSVNGSTGCGLYAILNAANTWLLETIDEVGSHRIFNSIEFFALPTSTLGTKNTIFVISNLGNLLVAISQIHNLVNLLIFSCDYNRQDPRIANPGDPPQTVGQVLATSLTTVQNHNFYINNLFYGVYTGAEAVNPGQPEIQTSLELPLGDLTGNGLTAAFGFSSVTGEGAQGNVNDGFASRAGVELFALANYMKYGGVAIIASSWDDL